MKALKSILKALAGGLGYTIVKTANFEARPRRRRAASADPRGGTDSAAAGPNSFQAAPRYDIKGLFQPAYYQAAYPDIDYAGLSPLEHYMTKGWREGKNPNPYLYSNWYMEKYPAAAAGGLNPLEHYIWLGAAQGYDPSPRFSTRAYEALYPEIGGGGGIPWPIISRPAWRPAICRS